MSNSKEAPLRLECLHLVHPACLAKFLNTLPSSAPASNYCCPQCKHPVVPEKWSLTSELGKKIVVFLKKQPWGPALLPAAPTATLPATPLRASMLGAAGTPKTRSRKAGDAQDVRLTIDDEDEDKYSKPEARRWSTMRILLALVLLSFLIWLVFAFVYKSDGGVDADGQAVGGEPNEQPDDDGDD